MPGMQKAPSRTVAQRSRAAIERPQAVQLSFRTEVEAVTDLHVQQAQLFQDACDERRIDIEN